VTAGGLKVLIGDEHELIREGLKRMLVDRGVASRVGEATNPQEALEISRREKWDLVILDINFGGRRGTDVLRAIKLEFPRLPVLILSSYPEEQFALYALRAGASGYLTKKLTAKTLIDAIQQVLEKGQYISPKVAELLVTAVKQPEGQPLHAALSNREDQVLSLIGAGRTVGEIAKLLNLSVKTVSTYRGLVLRKLGMQNNAQLMRYAQDHELTSW